MLTISFCYIQFKLVWLRSFVLPPEEPGGGGGVVNGVRLVWWWELDPFGSFNGFDSTGILNYSSRERIFSLSVSSVTVTAHFCSSCCVEFH